MGFEDGAFGRWICPEDEAIMYRISALINEIQGSSLTFLLTFFGYRQKNQETGLNRHQNLMMPRSWTSLPPDQWEITLCGLNFPVCGIVLYIAAPTDCVISEQKWILCKIQDLYHFPHILDEKLRLREFKLLSQMSD